MKKNERILLYLGIPLLSLALHWTIFTKDLVGVHVWRQAQTQINIENFAWEDFNIFHPRIDERGSGDGIRRMEFPVMQWLFAAVYRVFGDYLIISRILSFLIGLGTVFGMFFLLRQVLQSRFAALAGAWAFNFSPVFYYYTLNPLPDNFALCCTVWGMALFFRYRHSEQLRHAFGSAVLVSLGALAKLPFILCGAPIAYYLAQHMVQPRPGIWMRQLTALAGYAAASAPVLLWYLSVVPEWRGNGVVRGMLDHDLTAMEILDILQHNLVSTLPELLINYGSVLFFLAGIYFIVKKRLFRTEEYALMAAWGLAAVAYFLFELNMIAKVHDYYLFPFLPPIFVLVAYGAGQLYASGKKPWKILTLLALAVLPLTAYLRIQPRWRETTLAEHYDLYVHKTALRQAVPNDALCVVGNDLSRHIIFYYIDKKGWAFDNDRCDANYLTEARRQGAQYLYCNTRVVDENPEITPLLDTLVGAFGNVRVYRLK